MNIHELDAEAQKLQSIYQHARQALKLLNIDPEYLKTLHDITEDDLKVSRDLTDKKWFGQQSDALPWFWTIGEPVGTSGSRMQECQFTCLSWIIPTNLMLVYCVSWLRAKAHFARWSEELHLVGCEMQWMVNWFWWKEDEWRKRLGDVINDERPPRLNSYCHK